MPTFWTIFLHYNRLLFMKTLCGVELMNASWTKDKQQNKLFLCKQLARLFYGLSGISDLMIPQLNSFSC